MTGPERSGGGVCPPPTNRGAENPLVVSVDWVEFSAWDDARAALERVLLTYVEGEFLEVEHGALGYECQQIGPGGARILWSEKRPETHVVLPGSWCRATSDASMRGLLAYVCARARATRIDLAGDDWSCRVGPNAVRQAVQRGEAVTHTRSRYWHEDLATGAGTLYIGAPSSRQRLRVYDKSIESRGEIAAVRWEVQARGEAAEGLPCGLATGNWGAIWASRVVQIVDFRERIDSMRPGRCARSEWFGDLVGNATKARVYAPRPPTTIAQIEEWIDRQVAPSLAVLVAASGGDIDRVNAVVERGRRRWRKKHRLLLGQS